MNRRDFLRRGGRALAGFAVVGAGLGAYADFVEPQRLALERRTVALPQLPAALDGFRIALMSDHHLHPFTRREIIEQAVARTNELRVDLILLAGDYVYTELESIRELAPLLSRLNARLGVYAIFGNHDRWRGPQLIQKQLTTQGIEVLVNRGVRLGPSAGPLFLAGLDSAWAGDPDPVAAFRGYRDGDTALAMVHEPDYFDELVQVSPVQLQVSGHSHGGQVRIPGHGPIVLPPLADQYPAGLYEVAGRYVYTGRGLGMVGLPLRFDCPPELTEITLVPASGDNLRLHATAAASPRGTRFHGRPPGTSGDD